MIERGFSLLYTARNPQLSCEPYNKTLLCHPRIRHAHAGQPTDIIIIIVIIVRGFYGGFFVFFSLGYVRRSCSFSRAFPEIHSISLIFVNEPPPPNSRVRRRYVHAFHFFFHIRMIIIRIGSCQRFPTTCTCA